MKILDSITDARLNTGGMLTIDLAAIQANWRHLASTVSGAQCAGVVKADAYGLGVEKVAPALAAVGCQVFFVAQFSEGLRLRACLPQAEIFVLHGCMAGDPADFERHAITPVLNTLPAVDNWVRHARRVGRRLRAALQMDTGMARMGLQPTEVQLLTNNPAHAEGIEPCLVMSHLACAEEQDHPFNEAQRRRFAAISQAWPGVRASLANSSGIFLGPGFHHDLVRPGAALYGVAPVPGQRNPMRAVVRLQARVIQVHEVEAGQPVGYGCSWTASRRTAIATISVGYADGYLRSASHRGCAWHAGARLPIVGKVSMDSVTLDVSDLPRGSLQPGDLVDLINEDHGVDAVAADAGTIGYEILTSLGHRYDRRYVGV